VGQSRSIATAGYGLEGIDFLRALQAGDVPPPPIIALLGIEFVAVDPGTASMRMPSAEYLFNPLGSVHGGSLATLLDSVMGCAVHSTLPAGRAYTTLKFKVNFLRVATEKSGLLTAVGQVVHAGRQQAVGRRPPQRRGRPPRRDREHDLPPVRSARCQDTACRRMIGHTIAASLILSAGHRIDLALHASMLAP
jgi:uncharacterized protein (TIGR00369 family)